MDASSTITLPGHVPLSKLRRALAEQSPESFAAIYLAHHFPLGIPEFQKTTLRDLGAAVRSGPGIKVATAIPGKYGKSTMAALTLPLWCLALGLHQSITLVTKSPEETMRWMSAIAHEFDHNHLLRSDYTFLPHYKTLGGTTRRRNPVIQVAKALTLMGTARGGKLEDPLLGLKREPDQIIIDDLESHEDQTKEQRLKETSTWWNTRVAPLLRGDSKVRVAMVGTRRSRASLLATVLAPEALDSGWLGQTVYKAVVNYGGTPAFWKEFERVHDGYAEFEGQTGAYAAEALMRSRGQEPFQGAEVLWPERESIYELMLLKARLRWWEFDACRQNAPPTSCTMLGSMDLEKPFPSPRMRWEDDAGIARWGDGRTPDETEIMPDGAGPEHGWKGELLHARMEIGAHPPEWEI